MNQCASILPLIREKNPLIHHITNIVVANDTANVTLAVGASPVMASSPMEVEEMTTQADALILNLGTLSPDTVESCLLAGKVANHKGIPVILDPVGVGATHFRTNSTHTILSTIQVALIRGNVGEIAALQGELHSMRGIDALPVQTPPASLAFEASQKNYGSVVCVTGEIDYISDGNRIYSVHNGHSLLTTLTGTGCMASSLCGAFAAVEKNRLLASVAALGFLGVCAEVAGKGARGPGSFRSALFGVMYNMDRETLSSLLRIEVER